jgi:hypothetical protein
MFDNEVSFFRILHESFCRLTKAVVLFIAVTRAVSGIPLADMIFHPVLNP